MKHKKLLIALLCVLILCTPALATTLPLLNGLATAEVLPDGRVYEMVTPPSNYDADVYVQLGLPAFFVENAGEFETRLPFQVAADGEAIAYVGAPTVDGTGNGGLSEGNEYLSTHISPGGGWRKPVNIEPLGKEDAAVNSAFYQAFSPNLAVGILQSGSYRELGTPLLSPSAPGEGYPVLYSRSLEGVGYQPLFTSKPLNRSASEFATAMVPVTSLIAPHKLAFAGASADYGRLLFEANGVFDGTGAADGAVSENNLYESAGGQLSLVNVLSGGGTEANATFGAPAFEDPERSPPDFSNVISEDGSRIFWTALEGEGTPKALYVSEGVGGSGEHTVPIDASQVPGGKGGGGRFWTASKDGSEVFFTDSEEADLTEDTQPGSGVNLYMYEISSGHLIDLTAAAHAEVEGVLGEGETKAGEYTIYFVAKGRLAENKNSNGTEADSGADNLYMLKQNAKPIFVAQLSGEDGFEAIEPVHREIGATGDWQPGLGHRTAEVTPDGGSLVFMSNDQSVDGHMEEAGGIGLEEVYVYDVADNSLFCASCGREHGVGPQINRESNRGLGAFLPVSNALTYQQTLISEDGSKVFFDSDQPLVSTDTNGEQDVYEWEREGSGSCKESDGCVYLLSGGAGTTSSWLVGSEETGNNVFFVTRTQLAPEDENENYDLYDARVDGIQPVLPPACSGTGCQGAPASAPTFATPSSVTFAGVGNFAPPAATAAPAKPKAKTKPLTNAQKLAKALQACKGKAKGKKRTSCETQTRRRYGTKSKKK